MNESTVNAVSLCFFVPLCFLSNLSFMSSNCRFIASISGRIVLVSESSILVWVGMVCGCVFTLGGTYDEVSLMPGQSSPHPLQKLALG